VDYKLPKVEEGLGAAPQSIDQREEVRLAMGWNGGVSLAVWMGGVAVELDCARRAHLAEELDTAPPRRIYNTLCTAFNRSLVLDIFSGASAGGLNSALLGAAIYKARRLHPDFLRERWLKLGDLEALLQKTTTASPRSVMQGELFARSMQEAFGELMADEADVSTLCKLPAEQEALGSSVPLLDIQATGVLGEQRGFVDAWDRELVVREYRAPFRFRKGGDFKAKTLADAARASASFPAAFEPFAIEGEESLRVSGLSGVRRYAIDGGLLENAPIRQAIDLIPSRPTSGPVKRFVCYVNANPSTHAEDPASQGPPTLREVLGYVVNLPRIGRDIDQLNAIEAAARRGVETSETETALLRLDDAALKACADELLDAYRKRRAYVSLENILESTSAPARVDIVAAVLASTNDGSLLPWLPLSTDAPSDESEWRWGFRAAQRLLQLQLDLFAGCMREAVETGAYLAVAAEVYARRPKIDDAIRDVGAGYEDFLAEPGLGQRVQGLPTAGNDFEEQLNVIETIYANYRDDIYKSVKDATQSFYRGVRALTALNAFPYPAAHLFGQDLTAEELPAEAFEHLLARALRIEVIRRAFAADRDIDAAQTLRFTQLAPNAATRIFTSRPTRKSGPASGEDKLTGIRLGHFAGFYRRSWRANDFMWGRLDGVARIVDFLVDPDWQQRLPGSSAPWKTLAAGLVPDGNDAASRDQRQLVYEALTDATTESAGLAHEVVTALAEQTIPAVDQSEPLRQRLETALEADLTADLAGTRGFLTRVMASRAAQYEILRQELHVLADETRADRELGTSTAPLSWELDHSLMPAIQDLRQFDGEHALPKRLGRDSGPEATSTLALRTVAHAALVALAALPGVSMPLARLFVPGRVPFLAVAGVAARSALANLAVVLSFGAASFYLAARIITSAKAGKHDVLLAEIVSPPVLAMGIALLTIAGVVFIPAYRAARGSSRLRQVGWALVLALSGALMAVACGWAALGLAQTLTGSGGFNPGSWVIGLVFLTAGLGVAGVRRLKRLDRLVHRFEQTRLWLTSVIVIAVSLLLLIWSAPHLIHAINDWNWHTAAALASLASMPLLTLYAFTETTRSALGRGWRLLTRDDAGGAATAPD
jgi:predicted acylesterase/phospholipase RssA